MGDEGTVEEREHSLAAPEDVETAIDVETAPESSDAPTRRYKFSLEEPVVEPAKSSKIPIVLAVLFLLTAIALAVALGVVLSQRSSEPTFLPAGSGIGSQEGSEGDGPKVCTTPGCVRAANMVLLGIDKSANPCDDFYQHACGSWDAKHVIPDDRSTFSTFSKLGDELLVNLKALLEAPHDESDGQTIGEVKKMYAACLNEDLIEQRGDTPLHELLEDFGRWPIIDNQWKEDEFDLIGLLTKLRLCNNRYLVAVYVSADDRNSSANILQMDQFSLGLASRDYFLKEDYAHFLAAYKQFMVDVVTVVAPNGDKTAIENDVNDMLEFEIHMANISMPPEERRDTEKLYHKMKLSDLRTNISDKFDWTRYVQAVFSNVSINVTEEDEVVVYATEFLKQMAEKVSETSPRTLANYLLWRIVANRVSNLNKAYQETQDKFNKALYGIESRTSRWKKCASYTNNFMGMAVGRLFVNKYFDENAKSSALEMISGVREAFNRLLNKVEWMDDEAKGTAREKAAAIQERIGYPDWINNNTHMDYEYRGMIDLMTLDDYFANYMNYLRWSARDALEELRKPVDKNRWSSAPAVINAYYSSSKNQISFPAGILQPPFWQADRPMSMNYGAIGTVIGHEITHGFDDQGRQFDKDGNLVEWWGEDVVNNFKTKAQCIIDQYGSYVMTQVNMSLNGVQTQGENIADNGGIKQAYDAYKVWQEKNEEIILPGLQEYTPQQLFFLGFAQVWCGTSRDKAVINRIKTGVHSPGQFRVIGTLSNFEEFSKQFNCAAGTRMNPEKKCTVW